MTNDWVGTLTMDELYLCRRWEDYTLDKITDDKDMNGWRGRSGNIYGAG